MTVLWVLVRKYPYELMIFLNKEFKEKVVRFQCGKFHSDVPEIRSVDI